MGSKSTPPAPDYKGAAEAEAAANKENLNQQTWANRADQINPWGSQTWSTSSVVDPATGQPVTKWTQTTQVDPKLQGALDSQLALQTGRSELAGSLLPRAQAEFGQQMNWDNAVGWASLPYNQQIQQYTSAFGFGPQQQNIDTSRQGAPQLGTQGFQPGQLNLAQQQAPQLGTQGFQAAQLDTGRIGAPQLNTSAIGTQGLQQAAQSLGGAAPGLETGMGRPAGPIQGSLDFSGVQGVQGSAQQRQRAEDAMYQSMTSRLDPQWQQREQQLQTQLANRGITMDSEAFSRSQADFERARADAYAQAQLAAINQGGAEAQRNFGMDLGLRQQQVGEIGQQGQFANQAQAQGFGQDLAGAQARNQALQQQFGMQQQAGQGQLQGQQALIDAQLRSQAQQNAAMAQQFGLQTQDRDLSNAAMQAQFGMGLQGQQATNAALAQQFGLGLQSQQAYNQAVQDQFGMGLQGQQAANQALQQQFGMGQDARAQQLAAQQAAFNQQLQGFNFGLGQQQQAFGQQQAVSNQNFQQQLQLAQFQNQMRQNQLAEEMQRRGFSLNEINAIISGQQVGMPTFQGYNQAGVAQGPQYMAAAQNQYQASMDAFNAKQSGTNALLGAAGQVGSMAMMFSDRRVKKIGKRIGTHARGFGIYLMRYIGETRYRPGVIAQEVQRVAPDLVFNHRGVLAVNYGAL